MVNVADPLVGVLRSDLMSTTDDREAFCAFTEALEARAVLPCWREGMWVGLEAAACGLVAGKVTKLYNLLKRLKALKKGKKSGPAKGPSGGGGGTEGSSVVSEILTLIWSAMCADLYFSVKDLINCILDEVLASSGSLRPHKLNWEVAA